MRAKNKERLNLRQFLLSYTGVTTYLKSASAMYTYFLLKVYKKLEFPKNKTLSVLDLVGFYEISFPELFCTYACVIE